MNGHRGTVKYLVEMGANVEVQNKVSDSLVLLTTSTFASLLILICAMFLFSLSNSNQRCNDGLLEAANANHQDVVEFLIAVGFDFKRRKAVSIYIYIKVLSLLPLLAISITNKF